MASYYEDEMNSYFSEMTQLKEKITKLQEEKKTREEELKKKTNTIEPNMAIMDKWLKSIEKTNYEYLIEQKVNNLIKKENCGEKINEQEKRELFQKWTEIQQRRSTPRRVGEQQEEIFHIQERKNRYRPYKFMIDYIEATYNLFQIQQKRIDELEAKLETIRND